MRRRLANLLAALVFVAGLAVLLYPAASDLWNQVRQNSLMDDYQKAVSDAAP